MSELDVLEIDRALRATAEAWCRWRRALRQGSGLDHEPFGRHRRVSGRTLFAQLGELPDTEPLKQPLRRWVYRLAEQRINRPVLERLEADRRLLLRGLDSPERGQFSLAQMLMGALRDPPRRAAWFAALLERSDPLIDLTLLLWERRQEIAVRMGLPSPDEVELPCPEIAQLADEWLSVSDQLAEGFRRRELGDLVSLALGSEADQGWPARLDPRSMRELLEEGALLDGLSLSPGRLPPAVASSSFMRALARVGAAWVDAAAPSHQPFVIAHDPCGLRRRTLGALFGLLPLSPSFARRRLGLGATLLGEHRRVLARVVLIESRAAALRVVLRRPALQASGALCASFSDQVERAFGVGLTRACPGTLWQLHVDDGQRLAGLLASVVLANELVSEHDEDWFRNPRAIDQLRSEAALSPETSARPDELRTGIHLLVRLLTEAAG